MAFDYATAAAIMRGDTVDGDVRRAFVHDARYTYDRAERLASCLHDVRAELMKRDAEIALLKGMLLELESEDAQG